MDSRPDRRNKAAFSNFSGVDGASGFTPKIILSYPVFLQSAGKFGFFFTSARKCTKFCNARAEPLYCSLNLIN